MVIIYQEYGVDLWQYIRLDFETGEYAIEYFDFTHSLEYIRKMQEFGYTFIHR